MTGFRCTAGLCVGVLLIGALVATVGCGPRLPKVYAAKGKVVTKGKGDATDLAGYQVQLQSVTEPEELPGGPVEEDATFTLYTRVGGKVIPGVKEGTYRACLVPPVLEGGAKPKVSIPSRYTKFETANLQLTIGPGENDFTIEVER
jgi:hypothetical protein